MPASTANANLPINGRESLNSDPTRNFRFLVEFQPYRNPHPMTKLNFGFTSVAGLSMAVESIPYREGGMNTTLHQIPGQASFSPLTLTRGVHLGNDQAWRWMKRLFTAIGPTSSSGYPAYQFRSSVTIHVLQHPVNMGNDTGIAYNDTLTATRNDPIAMSFRAYNAWISSLAYSSPGGWTIRCWAIICARFGRRCWPRPRPTAMCRRSWRTALPGSC